jgi:two-component sensor histidine kinase
MAALETLQVAPTRLSDGELAREANHRISNHLSLLVSMVHVQSSALDRGPENLARERVRALLQETAGKIVAVGHLHRRLALEPNVAAVNLGDYLLGACAALIASLGLDRRVSLVQTLSVDCFVSPDQAQQVGLIVNEIILNAVKHAHPTGLPVQIAVMCRTTDDGQPMIEVGDDGVGLPEGWDGGRSEGVGFKLIRKLAASLHADLWIGSDPLGLTFRIKLPVRAAAA